MALLARIERGAEPWHLGGTNRVFIPDGDRGKRSITIFGGALVPTGGGEVSIWCRSQFGVNELVDNALMMAVTLGGLN